MVKNIRRTTERRADGEDDARPLVQLLNDRSDATRATQKRILDLLRILQELSRVGGPRDDANLKLQRYRNIFPQVIDVTETGAVHIDFAFRITLDRPNSITKVREMDCLRGLIALGHKGLLDRLRQCKYKRCQRWLFSRSSSQECCSAPSRCRQKFHESTKEYREKRNKRLRENYKRLKEKERKQLAIVAMEKRHGKKR